MKEYERAIIQDTFKRCFGLQSALKDGKESKDKLLLEGAIRSLSNQSCLRVKFIEEHLDEIIKI